MKGLTPLFLGLLGTFFFSWVGLTMVPNAQIGHLDPQTDEEGNDPYPAPDSGMADRGRKVYVANGCVYCHSQQVRPDYAASDIERKWGERRSAPRDYLFERPVLLGKMRMGPDLANIGKRAPSDDQNAPPPGSTTSVTAAPAAATDVSGAAPPPAPGPTASVPGTAAPPTPVAGAASAAPSPGSAPMPAALGQPTPPESPAPPAGGAPSPAPATAAQTATGLATPTTDIVGGASGNEPLPYSAAWHHRHLYQPRAISSGSNMPSYRFLYEKHRIQGQPSADALKLGESGAVEEGWEIVPSYEAECLVAYLMSLDQSHALKEVKSITPASPPAPAKAVK